MYVLSALDITLRNTLKQQAELFYILDYTFDGSFYAYKFRSYHLRRWVSVNTFTQTFPAVRASWKTSSDNLVAAITEQ